MIKNNAIKRILVATLALFILMFIYLFPLKSYEIESSTSYIEAIKMPIYLKDSNDYVARTNTLKKSEDILDNIRHIITTLTIGTNESEYITTSFFSIIPENTEILDLSLNEGLLKIDFSEEFLNVSKEDEINVIESLVFSLCEFEEVDYIIIFINGVKLSNLPQNNLVLPNTLDKSFGINKLYDLTSLKEVLYTTTYYISKNDREIYYVPITRISNDNLERVEVIINNLQTAPFNQTNLISYLRASASLESYEILEESINISFNNELIADLSDEFILEEVKYSIYLSLRDTYNIKSVIFDIPYEEKVSVLLD